MKLRAVTLFAAKAIACALLAVGLGNGQLAMAKEAGKASVADLRYGVALYHYYQQDYLPALSELMVANARDGIQGHGDNPALIAGGLNLAFGMQDHAQQVFYQLLSDDHRPQSVRDAAWFYLGKLQYARGDWPAAEQSFARVSDKFNAELLAETRALQINLQIKKKQFSAITLKEISGQKLGSWTAYALYNLGAAHARDGDMENAQDFLNELKKLPQAEDKKSRTEYFALLDKTYTASGYSLLQEKKYAEACSEFSRVRLEGGESNQALLGYGWAAMAQQKYLDAISPWQTLQQRSLQNPATQEALLALPFAYEKLNAAGDALREYENAEQMLGAELARVRAMRSRLNSAEILDLLRSDPISASEIKALDPAAGTLAAGVVSDGQNWLKINDTSVLKTRSLYLSEFFSHNQFQTQVLELRDLLKLQKILRDWQPKLLLYKESLQEKKLLRQRQQTLLSQKSLSEKADELQRQRNALQARLTQIKDNYDYLALADDQTRKTYLLVERSDASIRQLKAAGQDTSAYENKL